MEKHPTIVKILNENNGRLDRLDLATTLCYHGFRVDTAYAEIKSALKDGVIEEHSSGVRTSILLLK